MDFIQYIGFREFLSDIISIIVVVLVIGIPLLIAIIREITEWFENKLKNKK